MTSEYFNINMEMHIHIYTHTPTYRGQSTNTHLQVAPKQQLNMVNEEVERRSIYKANKKA